MLLMQLQNMMQTVSSISLADTDGHYLRVPEVLETEDSRTFDAKSRPWFIKQAGASTVSLYTSPYLDYFTHHPTITLYKPIISPEGRLKGSLRFSSRPDINGLRVTTNGCTCSGRIFVVQRDGKVVLHPDPGALFKPYVSSTLMDSMTSGEGQLYDADKDVWYYYYSFTNPDWFIIYRVANSDANQLNAPRNQHCVLGFALAAIVIVLFGLYLRHASRTVLMNIINAIKTGDVKRAAP